MSYELTAKASIGANTARCNLVIDPTTGYIWNTGYGNGSLGLQIHSLSAGVLTKISGGIVNGWDYTAVGCDGMYTYAVHSGIIYAYAYEGGVVVEKGSISVGGSLYAIYCDSLGYIYACGSTGCNVYTFNGTTFTLRNTMLTGAVYGIANSGSYLYTIGDNTVKNIKAWEVSLNTWTLLATLDLGTKVPNGLTFDGTYVIASLNDGASNYLKAYTFSGSSFSAAGSVSAEIGICECVISDGQFYYTQNGTSGIDVWTFNGSTWAKVSTSLSGSNTYFNNIIIKDGYIVYGTSDSNLKSARMDLKAQFTVDKASGKAPLAVTFTAIL